LVILKVSEVEPARPSEAAPKDLVMLGAVATVRVAEALLPVPPLVEVAVPVVLRKVPAAAAVTLTLNVQDPLAGMLAPERLTAPEPLAAVIVPPAHEPVSPFGVATRVPAGSESVKATPARATEFDGGFVIVKLSADVPFGMMLAGVKVLAIEGGATTAMLAEAVPPMPPCVEVTFPVMLF
jgi:hypothetical protein